MSPRHDRLDGVETRVDASRNRERGAHLAGEDRKPPEPEVQLPRGREVKRPLDLELLDVDVRLVEAVEQDETVGARTVQLGGEIRKGRVERRELDRHRDPDGLLHFLQQIDRLLLHLVAALPLVGRELVDVQLDRVRARRFHLAGIVEPPAPRRPVQGADDGDADRLLDPGDLLEVLLGAQAVVLLAREIGERFREGVRADVDRFDAWRAARR